MATQTKTLKGDAARRYKAKQRVVTLLMIGALATVFVPATMLLVIVGMVPTFVTVVTERKHRDLAGFSVAPLNAVGIMPGIFDLWQIGHTVDNALRVLSDPFNLLYILGASAVGWVCYNGFPPMIEAFLTYRGQRTLRRCRETQERLLMEWGDAVTDRAALNKARKKRQIMEK